MKPGLTILMLWVGIHSSFTSDTIEMDAETLRDKIRGGLLGQIIGNLNGLEHEMKYIDDPGNVTEFVPSLPEGAWTDDDTDFEWVYILEMQRRNQILLSYDRIAQLWKERINRRIWCSNHYARYLMDLGIDPPLTGNFILNPWADFNISGQFLCETFALLAPAMPQTASTIALNYTRVAIDLEPAQSTQLFSSMIAAAFRTDEIDAIVEAGYQALDPQSRLRRIVDDMRAWRAQYPNDWRTVRQLAKQAYLQDEGRMRDRNGYELNTSSVIAALLYGQGDFCKTLTHAFNFGWDADNIAATAGTVVGVMKGYRWMLSQGWPIVDRYKNTTRDHMPMDETITSFADRLIDLCETVILENGGSRSLRGTMPVYTIPVQSPACVYPLVSPDDQVLDLRARLNDEIESGILRSGSPQTKARAAYLAICLGLARTYQDNHPQAWQEAIAALNEYWKVVHNIYYQSAIPAGDSLRAKALQAGLPKPDRPRAIWQ